MTNSSLRLLRWMSDYAELMGCALGTRNRVCSLWIEPWVPPRSDIGLRVLTLRAISAQGWCLLFTFGAEVMDADGLYQPCSGTKGLSV